MLLTTKISTSFLLRLGLIALFCLGMASWFAFDGAVTYPRQRERALVYQGLEEEEQLDQWEEIATKRGWPLENPGEPKGKIEFYTQFILSAVVAVPGLLFLFFFLHSRGRWIELNETGLRTSWGQQLEFSQIVTVNKKKWRSKGIARINYQQNGRKRRLVLDDWKYDADATREILLEVELRIDIDQIVGGAPEPLPPETYEEDDFVDDGEET